MTRNPVNLSTMTGQGNMTPGTFVELSGNVGPVNGAAGAPCSWWWLAGSPVRDLAAVQAWKEGRGYTQLGSGAPVTPVGLTYQTIVVLPVNLTDVPPAAISPVLLPLGWLVQGEAPWDK